MQWYGHGARTRGARTRQARTLRPPAGTRRRVAVAGLGVVAALLTAGCSLLDNSPPSASRLPPPMSCRPSRHRRHRRRGRAGDEGVDTPNRLRAGTIGRVISMAPRADIADYGMGATTRNGSRGNASGYHFSTPDRQLQLLHLARQPHSRMPGPRRRSHRRTDRRRRPRPAVVPWRATGHETW